MKGTPNDWSVCDLIQCPEKVARNCIIHHEESQNIRRIAPYCSLEGRRRGSRGRGEFA